ncbi:NADH-quinone oxidoreductase subunit D [Mycobacterium sp.]|uniref:NADH-quinone oxidoreductase subunit D n=1 Tax=Mycobacterium sp. TaxID=1785 RepID=UPI003D6A2C9D
MPGEQGVGSDCALTDGETDGGQIATTATGGNHQRYVVSADTQRRSAQVMALIVEIDGKIVTYARCGIELLHSTIEKSLEHHSLTQCLTFVSQMDKVSPLFNEAAYCLGVERLMGIIEVVPVRANVIRILLMELNRIASHLLGLTTGGVELAALTAMRLFGLRERVLSVFNTITGARMNQAYIRPGGLARDLPGEAISQIRDLLKLLPKRLEDMENRLKEDSLWKARTQGIGYFDLSMCIALGVTGPLLRSAGLPHDLRRAQPYCGYETYEFEVMTDTAGDVYSRYLIRVKEIQESLRIVEQCLDRLRPGPIVADHPKLAWLTHLALGPDDFGDSRKHLARIMGTSMEALIHHLNEDVRVPAGQVYVAVESPCGELGVHVVSDGGSQPYRVHYRDPSFTNLQAFAAICEGATIADVIAAIPSIDPLMRVADEDAGRG